MDTGTVDLLPSERLLWEGRPTRHRLFRPADALLIPFSVLWCGFAIFWEISVLTEGTGGDDEPPLFFALWGIPFVLMGLYLVVGRFVVRAVASRRTRYMVTDQRVVIIGGFSGTRTKASYLKSLPPPVINELPDRSGSLAFGAFPGVWDTMSNGTKGWGPWAVEPPGGPVMRDIPEVRRVRDLVATSQR